MWDSLTCLKAWNVMIAMLLQAEQSEHQMRERALQNQADSTLLDNNSETMLLYLILSCAKMAKGELTIDSDKPRKRRLKQKLEEDAEIWENFLDIFLPRIPQIF